MIDYVESKIARREYEERVQSMIRVDDYDVELKHTAGHWQAQPIGGLLLSIGQSIRLWSETLKPRHEPADEGQLKVQEASGLVR